MHPRCPINSRRTQNFLAPRMLGLKLSHDALISQVAEPLTGENADSPRNVTILQERNRTLQLPVLMRTISGMLGMPSRCSVMPPPSHKRSGVTTDPGCKAMCNRTTPPPAPTRRKSQEHI
eukprot:3571157-Karenia_brevis.AAC.1